MSSAYGHIFFLIFFFVWEHIVAKKIHVLFKYMRKCQQNIHKFYREKTKYDNKSLVAIYISPQRWKQTKKILIT